MKERIQLELPKPCHENWNAMTPDEQGRYCNACRKTVVDFTLMSDKGVIDYMRHHSNGNTCARVNEQQLNRIIQAPPERRAPWKYAWGLALSSLLLSYRSTAQVKPLKKEVPAAGSPDTSKPASPIYIGKVSAHDAHAAEKILLEVYGRVVNEAGEPIPFATITTHAPGMTVEADSTGHYLLSLPSMELMAQLTISVSAAGYDSLPFKALTPGSIQQLEVIKNRVQKIKMFMKDFVLTGKSLPHVVVISYPPTHCYRTTGALISRVMMSRADKTKQQLKQLAERAQLVRSDIKVFPNPAPTNGTFTLQLNLKQAGPYNVQFIDVSGRIVGGRQINLAASGQTETFTGSELPGRGAYFVRVTGRSGGKLYNTKFLVE